VSKIVLRLSDFFNAEVAEYAEEETHPVSTVAWRRF
jgi:hypothetical protein